MIKVNVEIDNKSWLRKVKNPKKYLSLKLKIIQKNIKFFKNKNIIFTLLLTNSLNLKRLNKKFRNKNKSTDVLSFPFLLLKNIKFQKNKKVYIGDVAISYEIINFRSKGKNFLLEFDKVWIHGFLHLLGFNHIKNDEYLKMNNLEKKILNLIK
tara:strand:+ start:2320 stop:2778 length:459 start_codon:yes stop_codon:yes gene_type:complete